MTDYEKALALWQRKHITTDAELAEALNGHSISFAYHSGKLENENITYHDTREIFEHDGVTSYTGDLRTLFEIRNAKEANELFLRAFRERRALDEALTISSSWTELSAVLRKKGYVFVCDPYRRYATIRSLSAKKCMRTFRLGAEYDKEALQDRLLENQRDIRVTRRYFEFMRPYTREYARKNPPTEEYYRQRDFYLHLPRVTGYLSFFRCVAIVLGVAPLYEKEYRQPLSAECREACRKLDRFTAEITLVCREHLDTPEDVQRFLARVDREMDAISAARSKNRNKQRGCADPAERGELKKSCAACTAQLSQLRKQKQTVYNMIEDNPKLKALLACELDAWVENDPYLSPREKQVLRNQQPSQEDKTIIR